MNCHKCNREFGELPHYRVTYNAQVWLFCSRLCLVEVIAPEIQKAIVPRQWMPTAEEEARMSE